MGLGGSCLDIRRFDSNHIRFLEAVIYGNGGGDIEFPHTDTQKELMQDRVNFMVTKLWCLTLCLVVQVFGITVGPIFIGLIISITNVIQHEWRYISTLRIVTAKSSKCLPCP